MTEAFNAKDLFNAFNTSPDECEVIMGQLFSEVVAKNIPLAARLEPNRKRLLDATKRAIAACESPIEKAFVGGLLMGFLFRADNTLLISKAGLNAPVFSESVRRYFNERRKIEDDWEEYKKDYAEDLRNMPLQHREEHLQQEPLLDTLEAYVNSLIFRGRISQNDFDMMFKHPIVSLGYSGWSAFILSPQAIFPKCGSGGKDARVDIYIWCPAQPEFNMVVECDGYEWHSSREMFTSDRQRDRNFQRKNFNVYRFSGSELFDNMYGVAEEAWKSAVFHRFDGKKDVNLYGFRS